MSDLFGNHIVGFPTRRLLYIYSVTVTEAEIYNGILKLYGDVMDHCLCFVRIIQDIDDHLDHSKAPRFIDMLSSNDKRVDVEAQVILSQLRDEKLTRRLQNINLQRYILSSVTRKPILWVSDQV